MKKPKTYTRLPGRHRSSIRNSSLWLASDHLLAVDRVYFEEQYRRFHFNDIQALIVRPTGGWHVTSLIIVAVTLLLLVPGWMLWRENEAAAALMSTIPAGVGLLLLLVHLFKGRSCRCFLQMKVGTHDLPSVRRLRHADKILNRIRPLIAAAQQGIIPSQQVQSIVPPAASKPRQQAAPGLYGGSWHLALSAVLALDIGLSVWRLFATGVALYMVNALVGVALLLLIVAALVAQRNVRFPGSGRTAVWVLMGTYLAVSLCASVYINIYLVMKKPELVANQARQMQAMASLAILEHPFLATIHLGYIVVGVCSGIVILLTTLRYRRSTIAEPSP